MTRPKPIGEHRSVQPRPKTPRRAITTDPRSEAAQVVQEGAASSGALRRRPRQARAQERIARILDTAEQVFAEIGYDAATTNLIATQAETSIGSLYEFFPNKEAIAHALADRYVEQIDALYSTLFSEALAPGEIETVALVERIVSGFDRFYREHPAAVPLLNGRLTSQDLAAAGANVQLALERRIEAVFEYRLPDLPAARRHLISLVIAEMARAILVRADLVPLSQRRALVRELERAVIGYVKVTEDSAEH
jgi:AcrR family transcriptional regulator